MENGPSAESAASNIAMPRGALGDLVMAETPILNGFSDMRCKDWFAAGQISNASGDFQDAVPGTSRQVETGDGLLEQIGAGLIRNAVDFDFAGTEAGVGFVLALVLPGGRRFDTAAHARRRFAFGFAGQCFGGQGRDFDEEVDTVEEGARKPSAVARNLVGRAPALAVAVTVKTAGAGIHRGDQLELGGEFGMPGRPGDVDTAAFQRFAQGFQDFPVELGLGFSNNPWSFQ